VSKQDEQRLMGQSIWPTRAVGRAATAEEAERALTRLLAEWELRMRRLQTAGAGEQGGDPAAPASRERLAAEERVVQQLAALGPAALEPLMRSVRPTKTSHLAVGRAAVAALALGRMGDFRAAPPLLAALRDQRESFAPLRAAAALALGALKAEAAATLYEQALARQSADDWRTETERLSALRLETVVDALVGALGDTAPEVRAAAADAFVDLCLAEPPQTLLLAGKAGAASAGVARRPALSLLPAAHDLEARPMASPALFLAVDPLSEALKDSYAAVRASAATALGWIGDIRAVSPLARCLKDTDEDCRVAAALALGLLGSPAALKPLARALGDASARVRKQVAESLGWLGDPITADLLMDTLDDAEEALEVRAAAARALGHLHLPQGLPVLLDLLHAPAPALRLAAVEALGYLRFGRAYRSLAPLVWCDPDRAVRHAAARVLAQLAEARQSRARWRLRLALRVTRQARQEALAILAEHGRQAHQALRE
jgi:HEAT repeat protein